MAMGLVGMRLVLQLRTLVPWTSRLKYHADVEIAPNEERRRVLNRILYRSRQRGYLELDLLLGNWAQDNISHLNEHQIGALVEVLEEENPDLWQWLTGQANVPEKFATNSVFTAIHRQISNKLQEHASVETRAQPGQPWVRGWDDNRNIGGPRAGNQ